MVFPLYLQWPLARSNSFFAYLVEDFLIGFCQDLKVGDFVVKSEWASGKKDRKGKRQYLSDVKTREMLKRLNQYLEGMIEVPGIRIGNRQTFETLINEEALLLTKHLRSERGTWIPRIKHLAGYTKGGSKIGS